MITVVTGLPRSGTSLMMQVLKAGGMEILTDNVRPPDVSNPKGYFEYEKVKSLAKDNSWLSEADNKAVKVIAQLARFLPLEFQYRCILMERNIDEIMLSQEKMIASLGGAKSPIGNDILKKTFAGQLERVRSYLTSNPHFELFEVSYGELLSGGTDIIEGLNEALNLNLDVGKAASVIDNSLYRNRIEI